jgi:hypothetical protein
VDLTVGLPPFAVNSARTVSVVRRPELFALGVTASRARYNSGMDVERSSRALEASLKSFNALFATVLVFSLIVSVAVPDARMFPGCLLAAYFVKTVVRVVNSDNRRDECWRIAGQIGFALTVLATMLLALAVIFAILLVARRIRTI